MRKSDWNMIEVLEMRYWRVVAKGRDAWNVHWGRLELSWGCNTAGRRRTKPNSLLKRNHQPRESEDILEDRQPGGEKLETETGLKLLSLEELVMILWKKQNKHILNKFNVILNKSTPRFSPNIIHVSNSCTYTVVVSTLKGLSLISETDNKYWTQRFHLR